MVVDSGCTLCNDPPMRKSKPTYIGSAEACQILAIDRSTLSRWVALGRLPLAMRVGDSQNAALLFERKDVEKLAKAS